MENMLRSLGFSVCDDDPNTYEYVCDDEEYVPDLLEALGVEVEEAEVIIMQVSLNGFAMIYVDGEEYDATADEIVDAIRSVF